MSDEVLSTAYDRLMDSSFGLEMGGAPKAMADMVESLAGAVLVDNDFQLEPAFQVIPCPNDSSNATTTQVSVCSSEAPPPCGHQSTLQYPLITA